MNYKWNKYRALLWAMYSLGLLSHEEYCGLGGECWEALGMLEYE